jgi:hypothetical protein
LAIAIGVAGCLGACGPPPGEAGHGARGGIGSGTEGGYLPPPAVTGAQRMIAGRVLLTGTATPMVTVRLASPTGQALFTRSDRAGGWRLLLPPAKEVRLFGLSEPGQGRPVQAEGYVAVTPSGLAAQLRAGSGAVALGPEPPGPAILAADYDRKGGTVISGVARPASPVALQVDGAVREPARVDARGRFMLALNEPLQPGSHVLAATAGAGAHGEAALTISPAEPLAGGPFRATPAAGGWRVDWLTPGGGVQSTVLFDRQGGAP